MKILKFNDEDGKETAKAFGGLGVWVAILFAISWVISKFK